MRRQLCNQIHRIAIVFAGFPAVTWLLILAAQPVHIPILDFSGRHIPSYTQALSGVKGQTLKAPSNQLSRIDVWVRTQVVAGEHAQVKFQLKRSVDSQKTFASGVVVFNRSGREWQTRLLFDPDQVSHGETIYLRLESLLSSQDSSLHYAYLGGDLYIHGELLEFERLEVPDQDLRFKLYRSPSLPKPMAWAEAAIAPAVAAAKKASGPPAWVVVSLMIVVGGLCGTFGIVSSVLAARVLTVTYRRETTAVTMLVLAAFVIAIMAGAEAPIGKLWVPLS